MILLAIMVVMSKFAVSYLSFSQTKRSPDPTSHLVLPGLAIPLEA